MKSAGPVQLVLVLLTITWASSMPAKESTTSRYNFLDGHNTGNKTLLSIFNTTPIHTDTTQMVRKVLHNRTSNHSSNRLRSKIKKSSSKPSRIVRTTTKPQVNTTMGVFKIPVSVANKNKTGDDSLLISNFFKNNIEDLNTPNKTLKIVGANKTASTTINITKRRHQTPVANASTALLKRKVVKGSVNTNQLNVSRSTTAGPMITKQNKTWPNTSVKNTQDLSRYKNYTELHITPKKKKRKPVVQKVVSKWSDKPPYNQFKETWYDLGIPIPNPNPEISTYSPQQSIDAPLLSEPTDEETLVSSSLSPSGTLLNQLDISMNADTYSEYAADGQNPDCPTVHLTNAVFGPTGRQECSDLSIAINTHIHQNTVTERRPEIVESDPLETAGTSQIAAPPAVVGETLTAPVEAVPAAAATNAGGSGGGGGTQGIGFPSLPQLPGLPDVGNLLRWLGALRIGWNLLQSVFRFLGILRPLAPLLYIIPLLSFAFGFMLVLPFYPWWLPVLFLFGKRKGQPPPPEIYIHTHTHKPIHHYDGWFWNHNTKTWTNIADYIGHRGRSGDGNSGLSADILAQIEKFRTKYSNKSQNAESWKRRKK